MIKLLSKTHEPWTYDLQRSGTISSLIVLMSGCTRFSYAWRTGEKSDKVTIFIDFGQVLRLSYG